MYLHIFTPKMCNASSQRICSSKLNWFWSCFGFFWSVHAGNSSYSVWHEHDTWVYYLAKYIPWALENWYCLALLELTLGHSKLFSLIQAQRRKWHCDPHNDYSTFYNQCVFQVQVLQDYWGKQSHSLWKSILPLFIKVRSHLDFLAAFHWCNHSTELWNMTLG